MSWLEKLLPPRIQRSDAVKRQTMPEGLWVKCPSCEAVLYRTDLDANLHVCPKCSHHMRIRARARLEIDVAPTPPVQADGGRLGQVLVNLLTNASLAIDRGGPDDNAITVRTWTDGDGWVVLEVSDTGCGIAEDHLLRIFDPFYSTRRSGRGTGLGLAISHGIVTSYGGTIDVTSRVGARPESAWTYISARRLLAPMTLAGLTALSVEISTKAATPAWIDSSTSVRVPKTLFLTASPGLASISGTCL